MVTLEMKIGEDNYIRLLLHISCSSQDILKARRLITIKFVIVVMFQLCMASLIAPIKVCLKPIHIFTVRIVI